MNQPENHIDALIARYLAGEASSQDMTELRKWAAQNEENTKLLEDYTRLFEASSAPGNPFFNTDAAWNKVSGELDLPSSSKTIPLYRSKTFAIRIAAVAIILVGLSLFFLLHHNHDQSFRELVAGNSILNDTLPDGSQVVLQPGASLLYEGNDSSRIASLNGSAEFVLEDRPGKQFYVHIGDLVIKDIGTAFNVVKDDALGRIIISVSEGIVDCYTIEGQSIRIGAGETGFYEITGKLLHSQEKQGKKHQRKRDLRFNNASLGDIIHSLNRIYDVHIALEDPSTQHCRMTVRFNNEDLDIILMVISETLGLEVESNGKNIVLKGNGCD